MAYDGNPYSNHPQEQRSHTGFWSGLGRMLGILRSFLGNLVFVLFMLLLLALLVSSCQHTRLPTSGALLLNPGGAVVEQPSYGSPLQGLLNPQLALQETALTDLLRAVHEGRKDSRINMLVLRLDDLQWLSLTHARLLGDAIAQFRAAGKQVVAYGYYFDQVPYLLATYADAVYMHPMGQAMLPGISSFNLYFKELIDKLKINLHIFRVGTYKSFVEPYERNNMSDAAREANAQTLGELWDQFTEIVIRNRKLEPAALRQYAQAFPQAVSAAQGDLARAALEANLVDELLSEDEARVRISDIAGADAEGNFIATDYRTYLEAIGPPQTPASPYVSVVTLDGAIVMSDSGGGAIAADSTSQLLRSVANDPQAAAVVVRVDSPGGSSFASELIRQELELIQLAGKPVVVSMGNTAASGGYWISATADAIVAEPSTITGSIGIFSLIPTFETSLAAIGVHADSVGTTPLSGGINPLGGLNEPTKQVLQESIANGYRQFINLVARGRNMPLEQVETLAQGRIWSGERALQLGLVDALGSVELAAVKAAELAGLENFESDPRLNHVQPQFNARALLLRELLGAAGVAPAPVLPATAAGPLQHWRQSARLLSRMQDPMYRYVLCESCLGISLGRSSDVRLR